MGNNTAKENNAGNKSEKLGLKIVCISDTHNNHRELNLPEGDILIHAGDYTHFGNEDDAIDFNKWLGEQNFKYKFVVNGNHEQNAPWGKNNAQKVISNAKYLIQQKTTLEFIHNEKAVKLSIFGAEFSWPCRGVPNPNYQSIGKDVDIIICHDPCFGLVDGNHGCPQLTKYIQEMESPPRLVVSGHIHSAHGVTDGSSVSGKLKDTLFVNAAICKGGYKIGWDPVVVDI